MSFLIHKRYTLAAADDDSVFAVQTPSGAGSFTLNGVNVSEGVWSSPDGIARLITFTHAGNDSGRTMTVTGFVDDNKHHAVTESVTGGNATTAVTVKHYRYITSITISGAAAGTIKAGFVTGAGVVLVGIPNNQKDFGVAINLTGTSTFSLQHTTTPIHRLNDAGNSPLYAYASWIWVTNADVSSATATKETSYIVPVEQLRLLIASYTATGIFDINVHGSIN